MKYLKALAVFGIVILTDYFTNRVEYYNIYYLFSILSFSIIWTVGIDFPLNLITSTIKEIRLEAKKTSFILDFVVLTISSSYLFYVNLLVFIIAWILPVGIALFIGIAYFIDMRKLNK